MDLVRQFDTSLRLTWITSTVVILTASIPIPSLFPIRRLLFSFSGSGKPISSTSSNMLTLPQRHFSLVYILAIAWTTLLLGSTWFYALGKMTPLGLGALDYSTVATHLTGGSHLKYPSTAIVRRVWSSVLALLLMETHVLRRFFEMIYFSENIRTARIHVAGYLFGILFYIAAPLSLCSSVAPDVLTHVLREIAELLVKVKFEGGVPIIIPATTNKFKWWECVLPLRQLEWFQWIGPIIFLCGFVHQLQTHISGVSSLGWFGYVDDPIIIYFGILLASGASDVTVWLLFVFVISYLLWLSQLLKHLGNWYDCRLISP